MIHNIELKVGKGGQQSVLPGCCAVDGKEGKYAHVRLPSGEVRLISRNVSHNGGQVGNVEHEIINIGKAGRSRWLGIRPTVRGSAMNPVDHPHGGGEGKAPIGRKSPVTWVSRHWVIKHARRIKSDQYIVRRRRENNLFRKEVAKSCPGL